MKKLVFTLLFTSFSLVTAIAQTWFELGGLNGLSPNSYIISVCSDPSGNIYTAGYFTNAWSVINGDRYVAKWNGNKWSELAGLSSPAYQNGIFTAISSLCSDKNGNIYAGGGFYNSTGKCYVAKWNGTSWSELGGLNGLNASGGGASCVICDTTSGYIYAANFINASGKYYVAKWDGTAWSELGGTNALAANSGINSICIDPSGNIYAGGYFSNSSGKYYVAKWNGTVWSELGGLNSLAANNNIFSVCSDAAGNIYAAGKFTNGATAGSGKEYVAKWNGTAWIELGGANALAANDYIISLFSDHSGNIYAAGSFFNTGAKAYVAKWDGTAWSELGGPSSLAANSSIRTLCTDAKGNFYAAGDFTNSSGLHYVAKYGIDDTGIDEIALKNDLNILPNPNDGNFTVKMNSPADNIALIHIYNLSGELEASYSKRIIRGENLISINATSLIRGLYIMEINTDSGSIFKKLIVQ